MLPPFQSCANMHPKMKRIFEMFNCGRKVCATGILAAVGLSACAHVPREVTASVPLVNVQNNSALNQPTNIVNNFTGHSGFKLTHNNVNYLTTTPYTSAMGKTCFRLQRLNGYSEMVDQSFKAVMCQTPLGWTLIAPSYSAQ